MDRLTYFKFILLFLLLSCKSSDPDDVKPVDENVVSAIKAEDFIDKIQSKTDLVKTITKNNVTELSSGLSYVEVEYLNKMDQPMALYILHADLKKNVSIAATAAANGENLNTKETVRKQISYVEQRGHNVIAAVNADFWRVNTAEDDNTPMGQVYGAIYIEGNMVKDVTRSSAYYFAGLKKDGSFIIGDKLALLRAKSDLKEALGARYLLVDKGLNVSGSISNRDTAPRTSVGEFDSHNLVFIVVDGRRATHSQGVTMQELAAFYEAIGVRTAVNLDGGGSTTLLAKEGTGFVLKNKPSDNTERPVANAWTIIQE